MPLSLFVSAFALMPDMTYARYFLLADAFHALLLD